MIVTARIRYADVLKYLDVESIPGCDDAPTDWIDFFDCVEISADDIPEDFCGLCGGVEPEPEPTVNRWLARDFIAAVQCGDIATAQSLVGRVFEVSSDVQDMENALCRCAA